MKLLLVLGSDDNFNAISLNTGSLGFELIRYRHVLKAMDNIDEIDPAAIIISARDFPRHWKILVHFIRSEYSKEACPIIILKGTDFSTEETSKAFFLGANGVVADTLENREDIDRLHNILNSAIPEQKRRTPRLSAEPWHRIGLLIADLAGKAFVAGDVRTISADGLTFSPVPPLPVKAVKLHKELKECSLRIGDSILSPVCRVTAAGKIITLEFISFPNDERNTLTRYLEGFLAQEE